MFTKLAAAAALGAGVLLAAAGSAPAYTVDSAGVGWVGKGEVQSAYGWNNKAMQDDVGGVTFAYDSTATFEVVCEFDNRGGHHVITNHRTTGVKASVASEVRNNSNGKQGPMTGWYGYGSPTTSGQAVPAVGDGCPGNSGPGAITSVTQTGSDGGGLYALWNGERRLLTLTVVATTL